jgi:AAA15 family ATPase/GTPase
MLEKVGFKNFLALRDVELTLEPFTVIVGPNASGKSSILEGIQRITWLNEAPVDFLGVGLRQSSQETILQKMQILESKNIQKEPISVSYKWKSKDYVRINFDRSRFSCSISITNTSVKSGIDVRLAFEGIKPKPISQSRKIVFSKNEAAEASYSENLKPFLEETGAGLATVCSYLQSVKPEKFTWIQQQMQLIIPNLQKFRIEPAKVDAKDWFNVVDKEENLRHITQRRSGTGQQLIFDFENASDIAVEFVSEGTLFALTVLVAIASSEGETVLLIDDLERGLHPSAVREMIKALREIQKITPDLQIIATSHSPYILDKLEPKEVRVVAFDPEIGTMVASLEEYPNFEKWREAMTPGEFWSFVGEDWVKELHAGRVRV